MTDMLERLLAGRVPDPDGGGTLASPIRHVVIAGTLAGGEAELVARLGFGRRLAVISDVETRRVMGERIERALSGANEVSPLVLDAAPHPDQETLDEVRSRVADADALIAVGSGTINDLTKMAAFRTGLPFAVFGTAPSMNGYTSMSAAITVAGHKRSLPAKTPDGVFLDLSVLASAPARLIRAGFGDSICRATAQVDWRLAHLLRDEPYRQAPFDLLAEDEPELVAGAGRLMSGDIAVMERLARTLVLSGLGMTLCGGSMPASQGEHLISHYVEMMSPPGMAPALHGEQIAVTTVAMAGLQERMLAGEPPVPREAGPDEAALVAHFGPELGASCWAEFARKRPDREARAAASERLSRHWPEWRVELRALARPMAALRDALLAAGAPTRPSDLYWPASLSRSALLHAREIRGRYTFLDLAAETGMLEREALAWSR